MPSPKLMLWIVGLSLATNIALAKYAAKQA